MLTSRTSPSACSRLHVTYRRNTLRHAVRTHNAKTYCKFLPHERTASFTRYRPIVHIPIGHDREVFQLRATAKERSHTEVPQGVESLCTALVRRDTTLDDVPGIMAAGMSGVSGSSENQALLIVLAEQRGSLDLALAVFSWFEQQQSPLVAPSVIVFNGLLAACANSQAWERALQTREHMRACGVVGDATTYSLLLRALKTNNADWRKAMEVFRDMKEEGLTPTQSDFKAYITACAKGRQWERAAEGLQEMEAKAGRVDATTYNVVILALKRGRQWDKVAELFQRMQRVEGVEPTVVTFNAVMSATVKSGRWQEAAPLLEEMAARGIVPNTVTYNIIIAACERGGQWEKAVQVFERMKESGLEPDTISYVGLMGASLRGGQLHKFWETFVAMMVAGKWRMLLRVFLGKN
mmetsp:Transcript_2332/g.4718  ORF Transcript_2332/g.4718 Transcript_2332/m.4718 type:complete len:409 (-) Transcript_2332:113-1339(-)